MKQGNGHIDPNLHLLNHPCSFLFIFVKIEFTHANGDTRYNDKDNLSVQQNCFISFKQMIIHTFKKL